ncbi:MAG: helix-hairpin-helix domain-containing protein [Bacteroidia bacterium]|nr:helix-hairpin-helix domain-containing protein [Bacteroidia bacterium]
MNRLKVLLRSVFGFSRTETNAFLILLPLMAILIFSEPIFRFFIVHRNIDFSKERIKLDSIVAHWDFQKPEDSTTLSGPDKFKFDPNSATEDDFLALGFPGSLARRVLNYRAKQGKFNVKSDLKKIYGIDSTFYAELSPFINLPDKKNPLLVKENNKTEILKKVELKSFDLNLADTSQLKSIYGIGPVLADRIVTYRDKLGGFTSSLQLTEVYGLDTAVINRLSKRSFISETFIPLQLNVNQADEKTLGAHPYIKFKLARAIVTYRFQHGNFKMIDDLTPIQAITPKTIEKLRPYLIY